MKDVPKRLLSELFLYLLLFAAKSETGEGNDDKKEIKRGHVRHPYIVALRNRGRYECSGVLIGSKSVLTAAQCVDPRYDRPQYPEVWLNSTMTIQPSDGTLHRKVTEVHMHPLYTGDAYDGYDIAVLLLNESAESLRRVRFNKAWNLEIGTNLSTLGYGRTSGSGSTSPVLLIGDVKVVEPEQCINNKDIAYLEGRTICVQGSIPCEGDQGGPMIVNHRDALTDVLVGIISAVSCSEDRRTAAIQNVTNAISAGWAVDLVQSLEEPVKSKCSAGEFELAGEALGSTSAEDLDDFWASILSDCL